jgi:hypothetical protein
MKTVDAIAFLAARYAYETEHVDAAGNYDVLVEGILFSEGYDPDAFSEPENPRFGVQNQSVVVNSDGSLVVSIYLGQSEMECQLPDPLTPDQIVEVEDQTGWVSAFSPDLFYHMYPDMCVLFDVPPSPSM